MFSTSSRATKHPDLSMDTAHLSLSCSSFSIRRLASSAWWAARRLSLLRTRPPAPAPRHCGCASWTSSLSCCLLPLAAATVDSRDDERWHYDYLLQFMISQLCSCQQANIISGSNANANANANGNGNAKYAGSLDGITGWDVAKQHSILPCMFKPQFRAAALRRMQVAGMTCTSAR